MLYQRTKSSSYIDSFERKFANFCEKSPVLLSFVTTANGVQVINEENNSILDFAWKFDVDVKTFIFGIKQVLVDKWYPRLVKVIHDEETIPMDEQIAMATRSNDLNSIPTKRKVETKIVYIVDKCIIPKDIFLLKDTETDITYRYKLKTSSVFFLKKLRSGNLTEVTAADYFFAHSEFLNEITAKGEE